MNFEDEPVPGYPLPILPGHTSPGRLERVLRSGAFAITSELDPPDSADPEDVYRRARVFDGYVDAINATDGSGANCHMSSLAVCSLLTRKGYAPVMQISCRDKNRIAIQGDILGGAAMGVCNMLCLTGDGVGNWGPVKIGSDGTIGGIGAGGGLWVFVTPPVPTGATGGPA